MTDTGGDSTMASLTKVSLESYSIACKCVAQLDIQVLLSTCLITINE